MKETEVRTQRHEGGRHADFFKDNRGYKQIFLKTAWGIKACLVLKDVHPPFWFGLA